MENVTQKGRSLLMVMVMIASAILPMTPEAAELRDDAQKMHASIDLVVMDGVGTATFDEGGSGWYEVSIDEAPDGVLVITPSSDNSAVSVDPSYLKFTKVNWDMSQWVYLDIEDTDDDGANTTATISHTISGTDTVFANVAISDVLVTGIDYDTDFDGDGSHDGIDTDDDGDGVLDADESAGCEFDTDCDDDGTGDATDAFPTDATEDTDTDGDGVGDNGDAFPSDENETLDTDGDGVGDNGDAFPSDENETLDTDGDGVGDNSDWDNADGTEDTDTDGDGVGDNGDAFPSDENETLDTDGDGVGDNADAFPSDASETIDTDGDGVGNNSDAFPEDATETLDTDGDGTGDNADTDDDGDQVLDTNEVAGCELLHDCDGDGYNDSADAFSMDPGAWADTDNDGQADTIIAAGSGFAYDFEDGALPTGWTTDAEFIAGSSSYWVSQGLTSTTNWTINNDTSMDGNYSMSAGPAGAYNIGIITMTLDTGAGDMSFDWAVSSRTTTSTTSTFYDRLEFYIDGVLQSDDNTMTQGGWSGYVTNWNTSHPNLHLDSDGDAFFLCDDGTIDFSLDSYPGWVGDNYNDCTDGSDEGGVDIDDILLGYSPKTGTFTTTLTKASHTFEWKYVSGTSGTAQDDMAWVDDIFIPSASALTEMGTVEDEDDDGDGYMDVDELGSCASVTDPLNASDFPQNDNDNDYLCDLMDIDDDNDGVNDTDEADGSELDLNNDGVADGINCANTTDCDGDLVDDATDTHPADPNEQTDMDGDGIGDNGDNDRDGDGYLNTDDAFPNDVDEWADNDGDGTGDNADTDDDTCPAADGTTLSDGSTATCGTFTGFGSWVDADNDGVQDYDYYPGDGVLDVDDWDPTSPAESADNDGDGWGNNADYDDDNDGIADESDDDMDGDGFDNVDETTNCVSGLSDPQDSTSTPADMDGDGVCDDVDLDEDGDGTNNTDQGDGAVDAFPEDACADTDTDGDGKPDSLVAGCTSSLTEDLNDDSAQGEAHPNYYATSGGTVYWLCDGADLTNGVSLYSDVVYTSWVNDGWADCNDGSDEGADTTGFGPGSTEDVWTDAKEITCGTDPVDDTDTPADLDADGLCDEIEDDDNDGDGFSNADEITNCGEANDANDSTSAPTDSDSDGICDALDDDVDGDGWDDADETECSTDASDSTSTPSDTDSDGICDAIDDDVDGDGWDDSDETDCGTDASDDTSMPIDTDGDGLCDSLDTDDDGDGYSDADETTNCNVGSYASTSNSTNGSLIPADMDSDGTCDALDNDIDGDSIPNPWDQCEADASGYIDTDNDGLCDGDSDPDDDGDLVNDTDDAFPLDPSETTDTDGDGVGDNSDADDDGDGTDDQGDECPLDNTGILDNDGDGTCDVSDSDDDNDGVEDTDEEAGCEFDSDCDGDGVGDDTDAFDTDANASADTDGDGLPDSVVGWDSTVTTTYTLSTYSAGSMIVHAHEQSGGSELCTLDTEGGSDSCSFTSSVGIDLIASAVSYSTYTGGGTVILSDGTNELLNVTAAYSWYYDAYFGDYEFGVFDDVSTTGGLLMDSDDDGDGYSDADEDTNCVGGLGDSTDSLSTPDDNDGDGLCDYLDDDDDDDGYSDSHEAACGTDSMTAGDVSDFDGDGTCDSVDTDDDDDGVDDSDDWAPYDASESYDTDNDGVGDNEDDDADGDGTADEDDVNPTDRCSNLDTDGDGLTDGYDDCSSLGFYTTINADEGDNAGAGLTAGSLVGITDDSTLFGGAFEGDQWFATSDTDGVFRMYLDHGTGVSAVSAMLAIASTDWEEGDYYASYWVGDDGVTTTLGDSRESWGDIDNCGCEGFWGQWIAEVPSEDGYLMLEASTDSGPETFGIDNIGYHDNNWDVISMVTFEDSVEEMGEYMMPSTPDLLQGTYNVTIDDSFGDGGHGITVSLGSDTLCSIGQYAYSSTASCEFDLTAYSDEEISIAVDTDSWAYEGQLTVTFDDGSTAVETWSADTTFTYSTSGDVLLPIEGTYTIEISDVYADGGQEAMAWFDGSEVCSLTTDPGGIASDSCTFTATGYADSVLDVDFTSTDTWGSEGTMVITLPNGTALSYGNSADFATDSYSFAHQGTEVQPVAGEVMLSNGWGATVSLDVSGYHAGTVDDDDDDDGYLDDDDAFPTDADEHDDLDNDGVGSNADSDDDGDGVNDWNDDFPRHGYADTDTDGDGMPDDIGWDNGAIHEDWSIGNFTGLDWTADDHANNTGWVRSGDANWRVSPSVGMALADFIDDGESQTLSITLVTEAGHLAYDYYVSSEERYDVFSFSINGMEYMSLSGEDYHWEFVCTVAGYSSEDWESGSLNDGSIPGHWVNDGYDDCGDGSDEGVSNWYSGHEGTFEAHIPAGEHTFSWTYTKDADTEAGFDMVAIDNIVFPYMIQGEGECEDSTDHCNTEDMDDDADGIDDVDDDCPTDAGENTDSDGDGFCDNADLDDDNDGVYDYNDDMPLDPDETTDSDGDGVGDNADLDDDNDGCEDDQDDLPNDSSDCTDTDGDGIGDTADPDDDGDNVMDDEDPFPMDGEAWLDNDGDGDPDYTGDPPFDGSFEGGALPFGFITYGDAEWFVCDSVSCGNPQGGPINGSFMAEGGDIPDQSGGATTTLEWTGETLAGDVTFAYETSSETNWDFLRFYVDGSLVNSWSGQTFGTFSHTVSSGQHTFLWQYYKDSIISSFDDIAWVDDIQLPVSQVVNQSDLDDDNDGVMDEYDLDPLDPCVSADTDGDGAPDWVLSGTFDMSGSGDPDFIVDCDSTNWYEDWDDDGDGWSDDDEMLCGTNHLDYGEIPVDFDGDMLCDDLDNDLDDDGAINPVNNCEYYLAWGDNASFIDCIADGFHAVDANGDGDITYHEAMHAWAFQWQEAPIDDDDDWFEHSFFCGDGSEIPFEWVNDIISDCADGADEQQYDADGNPINWFDCSDGTTIWVYQVNDGMDDCPDGEDESWFYEDDDMDDGTDDEVGTMSHDGANDSSGTDMGTNIPIELYVDDMGWTQVSEAEEPDWEASMNWTIEDELAHVVSNVGYTLNMSGNWSFEAWFSDLVVNWTYSYYIDTGVMSMDGEEFSTQWDEFNATDSTFSTGFEVEVTDDTCLVGVYISVNGYDAATWNGSAYGWADYILLGPASNADDDMDGVPDCIAMSLGPDDGDGDGDGDGTDEEEPEVWPAPEDFMAFEEQFWTFWSAWDADNSSSFSFEEYWQAVTDTTDGFAFESPGWSPDTTAWDQFAYDEEETTDTDMDGLGDNADNDDDNDGVTDLLDSFPLDPSESSDLDGDGVGDNSDDDIDGDGTPNDEDAFDSDAGASADNDGDGVDDVADSDDDNDGVPDVQDWAPLDASEQYDTDGDGTGDNADTDDDGDGIEDSLDAFPLDGTESADFDGDGIGDNADPDDDGDDVPDGLDEFPYDADEARDYDNDGIGDIADPDRDEDGVLNSDDAFPLNELESVDTDGDGIGDNADSDDDNDGVADVDDWAPLDHLQWMDTDGDGMGDEHENGEPNGDTDDDGDGFSDADEYDCGTDSKNSLSTPSDYDNDGLCDAVDSDPTGDRSGAEGSQEDPSFTPGFASVLAAVSLLGAAAIGRREED